MATVCIGNLRDTRIVFRDNLRIPSILPEDNYIFTQGQINFDLNINQSTNRGGPDSLALERPAKHQTWTRQILSAQSPRCVWLDLLQATMLLMISDDLTCLFQDRS